MTSIHYVRTKTMGPILDSFFMSVLEWLKDEQFADIVDTYDADYGMGKIVFSTCNYQRQWYLHYEMSGSDKDSVSNAIVLNESGTIFGPRLFQCPIDDPSLWEKTLTALRTFQYSHWPYTAAGRNGRVSSTFLKTHSTELSFGWNN